MINNQHDKILKKCLKDELFIKDPWLEKLAIERIIDYVLTQINVMESINFDNPRIHDNLPKINLDEDLDTMFDLLIIERLLLFSNEIKEDTLKLKDGYDKILEGIYFIADKKGGWKNLSSLEQFKIVIYCIHIAEIIFDLNGIYPPDIFYYEISAEVQEIFYMICKYVFETKDWIKQTKDINAKKKSTNIDLIELENKKLIALNYLENF